MSDEAPEDRDGPDDQHAPDDGEPLSDLADELRGTDGAEPSDAQNGPGPSAEDRDVAPLSGLADEVARRRGAGGADDAALTDAFTEMDVPEIDAEELWTALAESDEPLVLSERVEGEPDRDVRVIPKRTCQRCPYFTAPPAVGCTHEGTDILALTDVEHHTVADCPMVLDEAALDSTL